MNEDIFLVGLDEMSEETKQDLLKDRILIIDKDISDQLLTYICGNILKWNQQDIDLPVDKRKIIRVFIDTNGGDSLTANQIASSIQTSATPVYTVGFGKCFSAGSYILASGHKRYCFKNTIVLFHEGTENCCETPSKMKDIHTFLLKLEKYMQNFIVETTKLTDEDIDNIKTQECYMFSDEAQDKGFVDKIIGVDCELSEIL